MRHNCLNTSLLIWRVCWALFEIYIWNFILKFIFNKNFRDKSIEWRKITLLKEQRKFLMKKILLKKGFSDPKYFRKISVNEFLQLVPKMMKGTIEELWCLSSFSILEGFRSTERRTYLVKQENIVRKKLGIICENDVLFMRLHYLKI